MTAEGLLPQALNQRSFRDHCEMLSLIEADEVARLQKPVAPTYGRPRSQYRRARRWRHGLRALTRCAGAALAEPVHAVDWVSRLVVVVRSQVDAIQN
jgi:hypothetical protein